MAIERWGSLSVADHNDTAALTANVLLYDRLVMPVYTEARDRDERECWDQKGWNPDLQNQRRKQLGELIIECAWDETRRQSYTERYQAAAQISDEVNGDDLPLTADRKPRRISAAQRRQPRRCKELSFVRS